MEGVDGEGDELTDKPHNPNWNRQSQGRCYKVTFIVTPQPRADRDEEVEIEAEGLVEVQDTAFGGEACARFIAGTAGQLDIAVDGAIAGVPFCAVT